MANPPMSRICAIPQDQIFLRRKLRSFGMANPPMSRICAIPQDQIFLRRKFGGERFRLGFLIQKQHVEVAGRPLGASHPERNRGIKHLAKSKRKLQSSSRGRVNLGRGCVTCSSICRNSSVSKRPGILIGVRLSRIA
jgi:hypothetical protein